MNTIPLTDEQQKIVEDNVPLVYYVANKYRHVPEDVFHNICSRLYYRLCVCAQRFNPERQHKISSYIVACLKGEIKNYFRDESWVVRPPRKLREMTFSAAVDSIGDDVAAAELHGENPQTIGSCAIPVPLHSFSSNSDDDYQLDIPSNENVEQDVVDRLGGRVIVREVFSLLRLEERIILALQMKGKPSTEIEKRFEISRPEAKKIWNEVRSKVKDIYRGVLDGVDVPESEGSITLRRVLRRRYTPGDTNYLEVRERIDNA